MFAGPRPSFPSASSSNSKSRLNCETVSKPSEQLNSSASSVVIDLTEEEESLKKQKIKTAKARHSKEKKNVKSPNSGLLLSSYLIYHECISSIRLFI